MTKQTRKVLIIDDDDLVGRALYRALRGHSVTMTTSAREAFERFGSLDFDIVLCDLNMPDMSGMDFYEEVRRRYPGSETSVVFMSGGAFTEESMRFLDAVPNPVLNKPFSPLEVRQLVAN